MRQLFSSLVLAQGMLTLACATAIEEGGFGSPLGGDEAGSSSGGSLGVAGSGLNSGGTSAPSTAGKANAGSASGGSPTAFGGAANTGGMVGAAGTSTGGAGGTAGSSNGGSGGSAGSSGGKGGSGGSAGTGGSGTAGSGSAGSPATVCDGVPDWTSKTYATGDTVASTCAGPFAHGCAEGQSHKFECNPMAGAAALPWCMSREPGTGNGWWEAWVDKGQCQ